MEVVTTLVQKGALLNVSEFRKRVNASLRNVPVGSLVMVDLIDFKSVNYRFGTECGDQTLMYVADELTRHLINTFDDTSVVCNYSSDLFLFYLPNDFTKEEAVTLFMTVNDVVSKPLTIERDIIKLDFRMTMTNSSSSCAEFDTLVESVEYLMRLAKGNGEKFIQAGNAIPEAFMSRSAFAKAYDNAILTGDLRFVYQPKHHIETGKVVGAEALCRWYDDDQNLYPIPVVLSRIFDFDKTIEFAKFTLDSTIELLREMELSGYPLVPISINMDVRQISEEEVFNHFMLRAEQNPTLIHMVEIELTEDNLYSNTKDCVRYIQHLKNRGYGFSVDDFGRGYSNLKSLIDLKPDIIKIDKSLIDNITLCRSTVKVLSALISMDLVNKGLVAEGVETEEQVIILKDIGITTVQGYVFNPPIQKVDFLKTLLSKQ